MTLYEEVKSALRIKTNDEGIKSEIDTLIEASRADLTSSGIEDDETNKLYRLAIVTFCKANFGFDNPDFDRFNKSYELVKHKLMNVTEYRSSGDSI